MMDDSGSLQPDEGITEPVPDPNAQAAPTGAANPSVNLIPLPLNEQQISDWWERVEQSRNKRKKVEDKWELLMKEYLPTVTPGAEDLKAGIHFRNVHTKKAKLFFRNPDLILTPEGPLKTEAIDPVNGIPYPLTDISSIKQAVLNKKLGIKGTNTKRMMSEALFDILAWSGIAFTKVGFRATIKMIDEPVTQPDPNWVPPPPSPGSILGIGPQAEPPQIPVIDSLTGQPKIQKVPVPIHEEWYWDRFSPKKGLLPAELTSGQIDKHAAWVGMEGFFPDTVVRSMFNLPPDFELKTTSQDDDRVYKHEVESGGAKPKNLVHIVEIWYKANIFDSTQVFSPLAIRQLVLIEGIKDKVLVHRPSPDQSFDEFGKLTPDSMIGFPIHTFTNRDLADTPWVWADNAFTNSSVKHINTHRKQSVKLRDANIGKFLYDSGAFTPEELGRLQRGEVGEWIAVQDGRLREGSDKIIAPVVKNEAARDDWRTAGVLKQDVEETLGIGGVNAGNMEDTTRTATEISTATSALAERLDEERDRILDDYLIGVEKFDTLLQRYATTEDYVTWVGQDGAMRLTAYTNAIHGGCRWAYSAKPDSQLRTDVARDRAQKISFMKEMAPFAAMLNVKPIIKSIAKDFGLDPFEIVLPDIIAPPGAPAGPPTPGAPPTGAIPNAPSPGAGTPQVERSKEVGH